MAAPAFDHAEMNPRAWPRTEVGNGSVATMTTVLDHISWARLRWRIKSTLTCQDRPLLE